MRVQGGRLLGALLFDPTPVRDERGWFTRTFDAEIAADAGLDPASLVQDSQSRSGHAAIRGLHARRDGGEGKLVRCSFGQVLDVAVDLRVWSPTFLQSQSVVLDDVDHRSVWWPAGLAHGFQVLSDVADVCYRIDRPHVAGFDVTIRWDDPTLAIAWPLPPGPMSPKDTTAAGLEHQQGRFAEWFGAGP